MRMSSAEQVIPASRPKLLGKEFTQRTVSLRSAFHTVGGERQSLALQNTCCRLDQGIGRDAFRRIMSANGN